MKQANTLTGAELFLMFLPNYLMETPLHNLLMNDEFELFNNLVSKINEQNKNDFLNDYANRIKEMFYFILENVCPMK